MQHGLRGGAEGNPIKTSLPTKLVVGATRGSIHQPEKKGKLLFISGAPGLGKSTSGLILSRTNDYVYYEADAFMGHLNPYVPVDVDEPSLATLTQNALKGVPQDRIDVVTEAMDHMIALMKGKEYDFDKAANLICICGQTRVMIRIGVRIRPS